MQPLIINLSSPLSTKVTTLELPRNQQPSRTPPPGGGGSPLPPKLTLRHSLRPSWVPPIGPVLADVGVPTVRPAPAPPSDILLPNSVMKRHVLLFGLVGGLLIAALRYSEYRFVILSHSVELYGALVAILFAAFGIWLGLRITRNRETIRETVVVKEVPVPAQPLQPFAPNTIPAIRTLLCLVSLQPSSLRIANAILWFVQSSPSDEHG